MILPRKAVVEHRNRLNHVRGFQQMPASCSLLRAGTNRDRKDMVRREVEFLQRAEHI